MKKALLVLLAMSPSVFAGDLTTFQEITDYLASGKEISVVVKDKLCQMHDPNTPKIPVSTMVIQPTSAIFTDNLFNFDAEKYSPANYYPAFPNGIMQRASFLMNEIGEVRINIAFFDIESNKKSPTVKDVRIDCRLNEGVSVYRK